MNQAKCAVCGAIFTFEAASIPSVVRCVCDSNKFELVSAEAS